MMVYEQAMCHHALASTRCALLIHSLPRPQAGTHYRFAAPSAKMVGLKRFRHVFEQLTRAEPHNSSFVFGEAFALCHNTLYLFAH